MNYKRKKYIKGIFKRNVSEEKLVINRIPLRYNAFKLITKNNNIIKKNSNKITNYNNLLMKEYHRNSTFEGYEINHNKSLVMSNDKILKTEIGNSKYININLKNIKYLNNIFTKKIKK